VYEIRGALLGQESSRFAQVFWFFGMLPAGKVVADEVKTKKDSEDYEEEVVTEDVDSVSKLIHRLITRSRKLTHFPSAGAEEETKILRRL